MSDFLGLLSECAGHLERWTFNRRQTRYALDKALIRMRPIYERV